MRTPVKDCNTENNSICTSTPGSAKTVQEILHKLLDWSEPERYLEALECTYNAFMQSDDADHKDERLLVFSQFMPLREFFQSLQQGDYYKQLNQEIFKS